MNIDQMENEIGLCSEIINAASKLNNANLRYGIFNKVGNYRQSLRERLYPMQEHALKEAE